MAGYGIILNPRIDKYIAETVDKYESVVEPLGHITVLEWSATEAAAASNDAVHAAITLGAAAQTITTSITNPPCARNITITCTHGAGSNMSGDVVITGTNILGETISETIAEGADGTIQGTVAFKTVTSIAVPVKTNTNDTVAIGYGDILGVPFYLNYTDQLIQCSFNETIESTRATVTADTDEMEKNTIDLSSDLNGKIVRAYLIVYAE